jgi:hypothetical protein
MTPASAQYAHQVRRHVLDLLLSARSGECDG